MLDLCTWQDGLPQTPDESDAPDEWLGLLGLWVPFLGPQGGSVYDCSGNGLIFPLANVTLSSVWGIGRYGTELVFDGTSNVAQFTAMPAILQTTQALTVSLWFKPLAGFLTTGQYNYLIDTNQDSPTSGYTIQTGDTGIYWTLSAGVSDLKTNITLVIGTYYHLVMTYDRVTVRGYINGLQVMTSAQTAAIAYVSPSLTWGGKQSLQVATFAHGALGPLRIYNRAVSGAEVVQQYFDPFAILRPRTRGFRSSSIAVSASLVIPTYAMRDVMVL